MTSQEANSIPLGDILSHYGYEPSRRYGGYDMYRSPFRSDTSPSFKVFREENRWYDFGDGTYGRAVDLVMRVENCSFPQAMKELGRMRTSPQLSMPSIRKPETVSGRLPAAAPMTVLKVIPVQNRHLLDYAASRGIDGEIVRKYCVEVHYCFERNPREKYALGFANDHRGFELRNSMLGAPTPRILPASVKATGPAPFSRAFLTFSVSSSTQGSIRRCPHLESWTCAY